VVKNSCHPDTLWWISAQVSRKNKKQFIDEEHLCCFSLFCCTTLLRHTLLDDWCYCTKHVFCPLPKIPFFSSSSFHLCCCVAVVIGFRSSFPCCQATALSPPLCLWIWLQPTRNGLCLSPLVRIPPNKRLLLGLPKDLHPSCQQRNRLPRSFQVLASCQPGTKILLTNGIYDDEVPEEVKGHLFLYEIVEWSENGKMAKIEYNNQVIRAGGDRLWTYKDSEEVQVSFSFVDCLFTFLILSFNNVILRLLLFILSLNKYISMLKPTT
jgi:hypothetical protein